MDTAKPAVSHLITSNHTGVAEEIRTNADRVVGINGISGGRVCLAAARPPVFDLLTREGLM